MLFSIGENKVTKIIIYIVFLFCLTSLIIAIAIIYTENYNIERQYISKKIDLSNKLNICKPDKDVK